MPWKETSTMDQRMLFIADYLSGDYTKKALAETTALAGPPETSGSTGTRGAG